MNGGPQLTYERTELFAVCPPGLETWTADEIKGSGFKRVQVEVGGVRALQRDLGVGVEDAAAGHGQGRHEGRGLGRRERPQGVLGPGSEGASWQRASRAQSQS